MKRSILIAVSLLAIFLMVTGDVLARGGRGGGGGGRGGGGRGGGGMRGGGGARGGGVRAAAAVIEEVAALAADTAALDALLQCRARLLAHRP